MARAYATAIREQVRQPDDAAKLRLRELVADFSIEVTPPIAAKHTALADLLPAGTRVYVAFVPGEDHRGVAATAARVRVEGLVPVPHFPARSIVARSRKDDEVPRPGPVFPATSAGRPASSGTRRGRPGRSRRPVAAGDRPSPFA